MMSKKLRADIFKNWNKCVWDRATYTYTRASVAPPVANCFFNASATTPGSSPSIRVGIRGGIREGIRVRTRVRVRDKGEDEGEGWV